MTYARTLARGAAARRTATAARSGRSAPSSAAPRDPGRQSLGGSLFHAALPAVVELHEPARLGLRAARHRRVPARVPGRQQRRRRCGQMLAERLLGLLPAHRAAATGRGSRTALTYCNARLSQALLVVRRADGRRGDDRASALALARLAGVELQHIGATATSRPIGSNGFYVRGGATRALRPAARRGVRDGLGLSRRAPRDRRRALARARAARLQLVPRPEPRCSSRSTTRRPAAAATGSTPIASNENQGAESTLSFLLALVEMRSADRAPTRRRARRARRPTAMTPRRAATRRSFTGTPSNPILTAADWPYPAHTVFNAGATRLARRHDAAALPGRGSPRALAPLRGALGERRRRLGHRPRADAPARPGALSGGAVGHRGPADHLRRGARQVRDRLHRVQQGRPRRGARAHRGLPHASSAAAWSCSPTTRTRRCCRGASTATSRCIHRPMTDSGAHIWISYSPDLRNWGGHKLMLQARKGAWWDANKVGLSPPLDRDAARLADALSRRAAHGGRVPLPARRSRSSRSSDPEHCLAARRLVDLRSRGALRARGRRRQRRVPLRLHDRRRRRHASTSTTARPTPASRSRRAASASCSRWLDEHGQGGGATPP